jgi:hypothetical protein
MFLGQSILWKQLFDNSGLAQGGGTNSTAYSSSEAHLQQSITELREKLGITAQDRDTPSTSDRPEYQRPKTPPEPTTHTLKKSPNEIPLPAERVMNALVEIYFEQVHSWIPMLHVRQFRERLRTPQGREGIATIFYAITSLCARFSNDPALGTGSEKAAYARECRHIVILRSMESFSVENLQALTICAFDLVSITSEASSFGFWTD